MNPIAETERLILRECREDDAPFFLRLVNDPEFLRNIGDKGIRDEAQAREYLRTGPLASYAANGFGGWCVDLKATGETIGTCGLLKRDTLPAPDLGYAFLPRHRGAGFAYEAAVATLGAARERFSLRRLLAVVDPSNLKSIRLLEKLGFRRDGIATLPPDVKTLLRFAVELDDVAIRAACDADREGILAVHRACFPTDAEAALVARLIAAGAVSPSLVATVGGTIVGHVAFSAVTVDGEECGGLGLAPLAVLAAHRRRGIGARLARAGLDACRSSGARFSVVLGEPAYYSRFGYEKASRHGLRNEYGVDDEFQVVALAGAGSLPRGGLVRYRDEFAAP